MSKTILHRLFGVGKLPKRYAPVLHGEGIVLLDEGIRGSVTLKHFRAPGRRHSWRKSWFTGCVVLTHMRIAAFTYHKPLVNVPLDHDKLDELHCSAPDPTTLRIGFDAAAFHDDWSGSVECSFNTPLAGQFLSHLGR